MALSKLFAFDYANHGQFFWNFRTELEPRWSYLQATTNGWIPTGPFTSQTRETFLNTCNALINPPFDCGQPIVDDEGFLGNLLKLITSPTFFIFGSVFVIVGILYSLKSIGGLGSKNKKQRDRTGYTVIPDEVNSGVMMDKIRMETNMINNDNNNRNSTRSDGTSGSGGSVEMIVDHVVMSDRSQWSESTS